MRKLILAMAALALALPAAVRAQGHSHDDHESGLWEAMASLVGDAFMGPAKHEEFRWQGRLSPGASLEIKGVNGRIEASPGEGDRVEVLAAKQGRRHHPSEVKIQVVEHSRGITICAVYPGRDDRRPNECIPGEGGRMETRNNDVSVAFTVKVPAGVAFVGRTVNGGIQAAQLTGDAEAHTVNGKVSLASAGQVRAETVNGSVELTLGSANWDGASSAESVNGSVTVTLPGDVSTTVRAQTVNGRVESEFDLGASARKTRSSVSGTIGAGGRELSLRTVNGSVRLRRAS
jgi:hypothetical protein